MNTYLILLTAIAFEVLGTMLLPISKNFSSLLPTVTLLSAYCISFFLLAQVTQKLPLAIVYATWAGLGVFSVTILSAFIYKQQVNWQAILGLCLIVIGVTIVNTYKVPSS